jgi:hypothetical protein
MKDGKLPSKFLPFLFVRVASNGKKNVATCM